MTLFDPWPWVSMAIRLLYAFQLWLELCLDAGQPWEEVNKTQKWSEIHENHHIYSLKSLSWGWFFTVFYTNLPSF
jgi:hypothetical protein